MILGAVVAWCGVGPFVDALRATDAVVLVVGSGVAAVTTTCAAWRWRLVARRLQVELPMWPAVAACYRSQFLNLTLPGGVLGDVDRGIHQGREVDDVARGLRAVAWERSSGHAVLTVVTASALLFGSPFTSLALVVPASVLTTTALLALGVAVAARHGGRRRVGRMARVAASDARGLLAPPAVVGIIATSLAVLAGHVATFWLAAHIVGVRMPPGDLVPLALLVLLVAAVPVSIAGWGPREGAAAWAFSAAGVGATQGLAVAVAYGAIVVVATLPGAVLLLVDRSRWARSDSSDPSEVTAHG